MMSATEGLLNSMEMVPVIVLLSILDFQSSDHFIKVYAFVLNQQ